jgi:hypothetical protein
MKTKALWLATTILFSCTFRNGLASELPAAHHPTPLYNLELEQKITGVVVAAEDVSGGKSLPGERLTLLTPAGKLDVQLGPARGQSAGELGLRAGDPIEVTGCVISYKGRPVLLARQVKRGKQVITLRTQRGYPISSRGVNGRGAAPRIP